MEFYGDTPGCTGRKAGTLEAAKGVEREGHAQDSGRKKLRMQALIWEGPWKLRDDVNGWRRGHREMRDSEETYTG